MTNKEWLEQVIKFIHYGELEDIKMLEVSKQKVLKKSKRRNHLPEM